MPLVEAAEVVGNVMRGRLNVQLKDLKMKNVSKKLTKMKSQKRSVEATVLNTLTRLHLNRQRLFLGIHCTLHSECHLRSS